MRALKIKLHAHTYRDTTEILDKQFTAQSCLTGNIRPTFRLATQAILDKHSAAQAILVKQIHRTGKPHRQYSINILPPSEPHRHKVKIVKNHAAQTKTSQALSAQISANKLRT